MKELFLNDKKVYIKSPEDILNWDSEYQKELYQYCYNLIPETGEYKPYIDVDRFVQGKENSYNLDLKRKLTSYELVLDNDERPSSKCENPQEFQSQLIIGNRLITKFPLLMGIFNNLSVKSYHAIDNAKSILGLDNIRHSDFKDLLLINKKIFDQTWNRNQSPSERQSGNSVIGSISENLFAELFKPLMKDDTFFKVNNNKVSSYGDFIIMSLPNNLWISVKSSNARERLLASVYNTDIIGIGFFKKASEFSDLKIRNYQKVGFLALYLPDFPVNYNQLEDNTNTYKTYIESKSRNKEIATNINGRKFIRPTSELFGDLKSLLDEKSLQKRTTTKF